ncbi:hypothetical protein CLF_106112 [Clonorchis sinensis]|uniref:Uncharacterized protein n=1 Tax=Clonorchis sinensis TaxID=79923 RepID=G7YER1_CLOSI|nr:hypothetical protein CLF_106112 [Clonorchis sinensis]
MVHNRCGRNGRPSNVRRGMQCHTCKAWWHFKCTGLQDGKLPLHQGCNAFPKEDVLSDTTPATFCDALWLQVPLRGSASLLLDVAYRGPSSPPEDDHFLIRTLRQLSSSYRFTHRADFSGTRSFLDPVKLRPASVEDLYRTIDQKVHEADAMFVSKKPTRCRMSRKLPKTMVHVPYVNDLLNAFAAPVKYLLSSTRVTAEEPTLVIVPDSFSLNMLVRLAGLSGALSVIAGAFGAHGFSADREKDKRIFQTGAYYNLVHSIALLGATQARRPNLVDCTYRTKSPLEIPKSPHITNSDFWFHEDDTETTVPVEGFHHHLRVKDSFEVKATTVGRCKQFRWDSSQIDNDRHEVDKCGGRFECRIFIDSFFRFEKAFPIPCLIGGKRRYTALS